MSKKRPTHAMFLGFTAHDWTPTKGGGRQIAKIGKHFFHKKDEDSTALINADVITFPSGKYSVDRLVVLTEEGREILDVMLTVPKRVDPGDKALIPPGSLYIDCAGLDRMFELVHAGCKYCGFVNSIERRKCLACGASIKDAIATDIEHDCGHCGCAGSVKGERCGKCGAPAKLAKR